ncbi:MAG: hypothetical protein JW840_04010 [Candidatus Thermoplasmatota archaeon]|nr:hypothetical protein [Candidatus Thermoplasmatota archaeon]
MMKIRTPSCLVSPSLSRMFLSMIIVSFILVLSVTPCAASFLKTESDQSSAILPETTESKTTTPLDGSSPEVIVEEETHTDESNEVPSEEGTEPSLTETENTLSDGTMEQSEPTEIKTPFVMTTEELQTGALDDSTSYDLTLVNSIEPFLSPTTQEVVLTVASSEDSTTTSINTLNVVTTQHITYVSAEISITQNTPQNIPALSVEYQNECIASYVTVHLLADNVTLSGDEINSMMMTFKIKKDQNIQSAQNQNQIYVLSYDVDPLFKISYPFLQDIVSASSSGVWQPLMPVEVTEDEEYIYYYVETSSYFATFAIVGTELVEIQPYQSGIPEIPWCVIIVTIIFSTTLLLVVLFKTGFIYQVEETTERKNKEKTLKIVNQKWSYKVKLTTTPSELQLLRTPTLYFTSASSPPQVITASAHERQSFEGLEDDPMYL